MKRRRKNSSAADETKAPFSISQVSFLVYIFDKFADLIYKALANGLFGWIFSSYNNELNAYNNGFLVSYFKGNSKTRKFFRGVRGYISMNIENSFILRKLREFVRGLADVPLSAYGKFLLSFGIYVILFYFVKTLVPSLGVVAEVDHLYVGIIICILSIPFQSTSKALGHVALNSKITKFLFIDVFGYREEAFEETRNKKLKDPSSKAIFIGLVFGVLSFFINPMILILSLALIFIITLILISPEIGILLTLFGLPFFSFFNNPSLLTAMLLFVTVISYAVKLIRGKRILKLELIDSVILLFLLIVFFTGVITVGGKASQDAALLTCLLMCAYFLIVNLMRTEKWIIRCVYAIVFSGSVTALLGVLQYVLGFAKKDWIDLEYFVDIPGRVTSLFENPNYLSVYLILVFPFALYTAINAKLFKTKVLCSTATSLIVLCVIFTWSRAAWIAILASIIIFFLLISQKTLRYIFAALLAIPFMPLILPKNIMARITSIGDLTDSSSLYRLYTWRGSLNMIKDYFWGGIGYGQGAFSEIYPLYAYAGIETVAHSHNLYLEILIMGGIGALICFALVMFFFSQKCLTYLQKPSSSISRFVTIASLAGVIAVLIIGMFDYVWYNYRVLFMFWAVIGMGVACIRVGKKEYARVREAHDDCDDAASINIEF